MYTTSVPEPQKGRISFTVPAAEPQARITVYYDLSRDDYHYDYQLEAVDDAIASQFVQLIEQPIMWRGHMHEPRTHGHLSALMAVLEQQNGASVEATPYYKPPGAVF